MIRFLGAVLLLLVLVTASDAQDYNNRDLFAAMDCENVTPADSDLTSATRLVMVGTSGTLRVTFVSGRIVTLPAAVVVNAWSAPISVVRIWATGTSASDIVACR